MAVQLTHEDRKTFLALFSPFICMYSTRQCQSDAKYLVFPPQFFVCLFVNQSNNLLTVFAFDLPGVGNELPMRCKPLPSLRKKLKPYLPPPLQSISTMASLLPQLRRYYFHDCLFLCVSVSRITQILLVGTS